MSKHRTYRKQNVRIDSTNHSYFDKYPTLTVNRYWIPKQYKDAVDLSIKLYKSDVPFNKAIDQASAAYPQTNRNKLAEHTLKYIANDY